MPPAAGLAPQPLVPVTTTRVLRQLVVHCSATPSGQYLRGGNAAVIIDQWHRERGFRRALRARSQFNPDLLAIGYHYVVDIDGKVWTGRGLDEIGAHTIGHNNFSVGICLVGGAEVQARYTLDQWKALDHLLCALLKLCEQGAQVLGHRDLSPDANGDGRVVASEWLKTCPGFDVRGWLANGMQPLSYQVAPRPTARTTTTTTTTRKAA